MEVLHVSLLVSSELFLESTHYILSQLERLSENIRVDRWIRPKDCICNGDDARILAAQSSNSNCMSLCNMELKMNEASWIHENISWAQDFRDKMIIWIWCDNTNMEGAIQN